MHYVKSDQGKDTIILLTGFGTAYPTLDFKPFIEKLSDYYTVYAIEPFGYGLSDVVDSERNLKNVTDELHQAIEALDIKDEYFLMGHSISGIYSIKYADTYPEEVKGLIGIDSSIPGQEEMPVNGTLGYKIMNFFGVYRFAALVAPSAIIPAELAYSKEEKEKSLRIISYNMYNKSIVSEMNQLQISFEAVAKIELNPTLPILIFLAEDSVNDGGSWIELHDDFMSNQVNYQHIVLEGSHYLHRMSGDDIINETNKFINNLNNASE